MKRASVWFEIYVEDMDRAVKFYEKILETKLDVLGDPTDQNLEMMSFSGDMEKYGSGGALVKMKGMKSGGNSTIIYFGCDDCSVEESRIQEAGGKVMKPKMSIGQHGHIVLAFDTEGNIFGLHSMK